MSKPVYCVYACDGWNSRNSMRLQALCTTQSSLKRVLVSGIKAECFLYPGQTESFRSQAARFARDWAGCCEDPYLLEQLINNLRYAYVEQMTPNENPFT